MSHLDPRSPLVVDTRELGRRAGAMVELERTVPAPEEFGTAVMAVPAGDPVELDLRLESVVEGVLVSGSAVATAVGACVRCLDQVSEPVDVDFQELYAYADRSAHHREEGSDEDILELDGDLADLEPMLRDVVVPTLPFQPVCRPDCPGLCSECGERLEDDPDHHHDVIDPRWAELASIAALAEPGADAPASTTDNEKRN